MHYGRQQRAPEVRQPVDYPHDDEVRPLVPHHAFQYPFYPLRITLERDKDQEEPYDDTDVNAELGDEEEAYYDERYGVYEDLLVKIPVDVAEMFDYLEEVDGDGYRQQDDERVVEPVPQEQQRRCTEEQDPHPEDRLDRRGNHDRYQDVDSHGNVPSLFFGG